jgi:hypothetical protein
MRNRNAFHFENKYITTIGRIFDFIQPQRTLYEICFLVSL